MGNQVSPSGRGARAAEHRARDTESVATAAADVATKEKILKEDLLKKEIAKYANLEKFAIASP